VEKVKQGGRGKGREHRSWEGGRGDLVGTEAGEEGEWYGSPIERESFAKRAGAASNSPGAFLTELCFHLD
jgi:hypothetical protein